MNPENEEEKFELNQSAQKVRKSSEPNALKSGIKRINEPGL